VADAEGPRDSRQRLASLAPGDGLALLVAVLSFDSLPM
jgi:hypothetical protein